MKKMTWVKAWLQVGILLVGGTAAAQATASSTEQTESGGDAQFLTRALSVNELELRLGKMASERAATPEVKAMGAQMVQKHTEFGQKLADIAQQIGAAGTPELSSEEQVTFTRLESLPKGDFDRSFKETVDAGHVQELAMYRDEVSHAASPRLRALAQQRVATLEQTVAKAAPSKKVQPRDEW